LLAAVGELTFVKPIRSRALNSEFYVVCRRDGKSYKEAEKRFHVHTFLADQMHYCVSGRKWIVVSSNVLAGQFHRWVSDFAQSLYFRQHEALVLSRGLLTRLAGELRRKTEGIGLSRTFSSLVQDVCRPIRYDSGILIREFEVLFRKAPGLMPPERVIVKPPTSMRINHSNKQSRQSKKQKSVKKLKNQKDDIPGLLKQSVSADVYFTNPPRPL